MNIHERIRINKWSKLECYNPKDVLIKLRKLETLVALSNLDPREKFLRKQKFKKYLEWRAAAIFCYGLAESVLKSKICYIPTEAEDFDFIAVWKKGNCKAYTPVQIKEVVPDRINPQSDLNREIAKLVKYSDSKDLVVAIYINKRQKLEFSKIKVPVLQIAELWIFGALTEDQSKWFLYGDLLTKPNFFEFKYPG